MNVDTPTKVYRTADEELVSLQRTLYESRNPTRRWLHRTRKEWISSAIRRFGAGARCALEVGPGSGIYIPVLQEVSPEVYVSDCEPCYLSAIERSYGHDRSVRIVVDDVTASKLPAGYFDLVLCTEVVEHIADSSAALRNIARLLKPQGVLILSTPQRYSTLELTAKLALSPWFIGLTRYLYREPVLEMGHINLMTDSALQSQIEAAGLQVLAQHKSGLYLPGVAELLGQTGLRIERALERRLQGTRCDFILWTQYYVLTRRSVAVS